MDVLCTDKTGTLTEAKIRLERHVDALGRESARVLELAYLNSYFESGLKSPLDDAILQHGEIDISGWQKIDEVPFDFERRRVSVLVERKGARMLAVKGAPEDTLRLCTHYEGETGIPALLDDASRVRIQAQYDALSQEGFRVLGIAWRPVTMDHPHAVVTDETELVFAGFAAFLDPAKDSAGEALAALQASGVEVKIVTGDNELVTRHVCEQLGVTVTGVLTGADIQAMNDDALRVKAEAANLFCRVNPAQKNRILLALKARGHVGGMAARAGTVLRRVALDKLARPRGGGGFGHAPVAHTRFNQSRDHRQGNLDWFVFSADLAARAAATADDFHRATWPGHRAPAVS